MASKLEIYNGALLELGSRKLASLSTDTEARRTLDELYTKVVNYCLEKGFWKFAMRYVKLDYSPSVTTEFGYTYGFEKPTDIIMPYKICLDEDMKYPITDYSEDVGFWYAYQTEIYVAYVSNHVDFGLNVSEWPESFTQFVQLQLANKAFNRIKPATDGAGGLNRDDLRRELKTAFATALSKDAMKGAPQFPPTGSWSNSRGNSFSNGGRQDRGGRGSLIG